jgi:hypothetical protein
MHGEHPERDGSADRPPAGPAPAVLELEAPWSRDFDDPAREWRRLISEVFGTLLLVMVGAGGAVVDAVSGGQIGRGAAVTVALTGGLTPRSAHRPSRDRCPPVLGAWEAACEIWARRLVGSSARRVRRGGGVSGRVPGMAGARSVRAAARMVAR